LRGRTPVEHDHLVPEAPGKKPRDHGVVLRDAAGHDHPPLERVHFQNALHHRVVHPVRDVLEARPLADEPQDLRLGEHRTKAAQAHGVRGLLREAVHFGQLHVEPQRRLLEKRAGAGGALAVHPEAQALSPGVDADDLVVLAADVHHGDGLGKEEVDRGGVAGDLGHGLVGKADVRAAVAGRDGPGDRVPVRVRLGQGVVEVLQCSRPEVHARAADRGADGIPGRIDEDDLGGGCAGVHTAEELGHLALRS
jgi:hypothetical protein